MKNSQKYGPPNGYYKRTENRELRDYIKTAVSYVENPANKVALDFGCGAGGDTKFLLEQGFIVMAVDGSAKAQYYIQKLGQNVTFIQSDFEDFQFEKYDFINAAFSLPFADKNKFDDIFTALKASLNPDGVFAGQLFGVNDEWNKPGETMSFHTRNQVELLLDDLEILLLEEKDEMGSLAKGTPKHWHLFNIIAKQAKDYKD